MSEAAAGALGNAVSGVLTIFLVGSLGFILARSGKIAPETIRGLPRFITLVILPPYLCRSILVIFERDQLMGLLYGLGIPICSIAVCFLLAALLARLLNVRPGRRGTFCAAFATSSTLNIGLPISIALFSEEALPYTLLYFMANSVFFWTLGNWCIARDGDAGGVPLFSKATLGRVLSPPLLGFGAGVLLVLLGWHLPAFADKSFKYVGDMAIGLSIMYVGIMLSDIRLRDMRPDREVLAVLAGRFLVAPATVVLLAIWMPIPPLMRDVFIIQASLPVMMNVAILAGAYRADVRYASLVTSLSTVICLVTIPGYMLWLATS